jgi:serine protease Do
MLRFRGQTILVVCAALWLASAQAVGAVDEPPPSFAKLAKQVAPAVVNIYVAKQARGHVPFFPFPFPMEPQPQRGQGTGFIIDPAGYIVTNNHVVQGSDEIRVRLMDKRELSAKIVGTDPKTDLALVKIEADNLPALKFGNSDELQVGDWVIAVGNPLGLAHTVTAGIVSAKGRSLGVGPYDDYIQTDASINPGNSGGPLVNTKGEVVGVNALIAASGQGIGFAIPSNLSQSIITQLRAGGKVTRAWLGVSYQPVTNELAESFGLERAYGALVNRVFDDSPAKKAGIKNGDIIVEFNGRTIGEASELPLLVAQVPIGQAVAVKVIRERQPITLTVQAAQQPDTVARGTDTEGDEEEGQPERGRARAMILGMELTDLTPESARRLGIEYRRSPVIVYVKPMGPAARAGLARGDVVLSLNHQRVETSADLANRIEKLPPGSRIVLYIQRGENTFYAALAR